MEKVLILIDDDAATNLYNKQIANKTNSFKEIICLDSAANALNYFNNFPFKDVPNNELVIIVDANMPGMDGLELIDELYDLDLIEDDMFVAILTSSLALRVEENANKLPFLNQFIPKPLTKEKVNEIIKEIND